MWKTSLSFGVALLFLCCVLTPCPGQEKPAVRMHIGGYDYQLPDWWEGVRVVVPDELQTREQIHQYVVRHYGSDTGTEKNWKAALKTWAIACQRANLFTTYLGHCHKIGGEYARAAQIYGDLYRLADRQKEQRDSYPCYLAYSAGEMYLKTQEPAKAKLWFGRSAEYVHHADKGIHYYANSSAAILKELK